jgi:hypothetical protein
MLQIKKGLIALSMLTAFNLCAMQNKLAIIHKNNDFSVETNEGTFPIQRCYIDKDLRGISEENLAKLATAGAYLKINKMKDCDAYSLHLGGRLNGGGPLFGAFCYWLVKGVGYGVPIVVGATAAGSAAGIVGGQAVGNSLGLGMAAVQTGTTASVMTALPGMSTAFASIPALPVIGFGGAAPAGYTLATATAAELTAYTAAVAEAVGTAPVFLVNPVVSGFASAAPALPYGAPIANAAAAGVGVGKVIITTIGVEAAGAAMGTITAAANGAAGYVAAVEGAASTAGAIATLCPFLP